MLPVAPFGGRTGCGAAWLARCVRDAEVPGSNPGSPTRDRCSERVFPLSTRCCPGARGAALGQSRQAEAAYKERPFRISQGSFQFLTIPEMLGVPESRQKGRFFTVASQRSDRLSRALTLSKSSDGRRNIAYAGFARLARLGSRFGSPMQHLGKVTAVPNPFTREAVRVFVTLGLPDLIASGISDIAELAERSEVDEDALARVANHLVREGILASPTRGKVALTAAGELLRSDHPESQNLYFQLEGASARMEAAQRDLLYSVRTGKPAYAHANGAEMWDQMAKQPILTASFDAMMAEHARTIAPGFAKNYDWQGISQVADVGGGTGELLGQILRRIPSTARNPDRIRRRCRPGSEKH